VKRGRGGARATGTTSTPAHPVTRRRRSTRSSPGGRRSSASLHGLQIEERHRYMFMGDHPPAVHLLENPQSRVPSNRLGAAVFGITLSFAAQVYRLRGERRRGTSQPRGSSTRESTPYKYASGPIAARNASTSTTPTCTTSYDIGTRSGAAAFPLTREVRPFHDGRQRRSRTPLPQSEAV
jgi:hypothetical protein